MYAGCAARAALKMTRNVRPYVGSLAVVGAVHTEGAFMFQRFQRLHEVTMLKISSWVFNKPNFWISFTDDIKDGVNDVVGSLQITCFTCSFCWGVLITRWTCPDEVKEV